MNHEQPKSQTEVHSAESNVLRSFETGRMLFDDVLNFWPQPISLMGDSWAENLMPIPYYTEGYGTRAKDENSPDHEYNKAIYEKVVELSDPQQVTIYDNLVDEYNEQLPQLIEEGNKDKVLEFTKKAQEIVLETKQR